MEDLQKNDLGRSFISGTQAGGGRGPGLGHVVRSFTGFYGMPINLLFTAHTVFSSLAVSNHAGLERLDSHS